MEELVSGLQGPPGIPGRGRPGRPGPPGRIGHQGSRMLFMGDGFCSLLGFWLRSVTAFIRYIDIHSFSINDIRFCKKVRLARSVHLAIAVLLACQVFQAHRVQKDLRVT